MERAKQKREAEKKLADAKASFENSLAELDLKVELQTDRIDSKEVELKKSLESTEDISSKQGQSQAPILVQEEVFERKSTSHRQDASKQSGKATLAQ